MDELPVDISTMKVTALKKALKARGLATTGIKTELVERLQSSIMQTEDDSDLLDEANALLAEDSTQPLEDAVDSKVEMTTEPQQKKKIAIKRDSSLATAPQSIIDQHKVEAPVASPQLKDEEDPAVHSGVTASGKKKITPPEENSSPTKVTVVGSTEAKGQDEEAKGQDEEAKVEPTPPKPTTDAERAELRAARFGTPSFVGNDDEKKASRAARFGLPQSDNKKIGTVPCVDLDTLKRRAERFGQCSSTTMKKLELLDQIKKRQERFGAESATPNKKAKVVVNENLIDEKIRKRAERFGTEIKT